ncbi:MAG: PilN domain-containing protein [Pseudomonadota bacterium]
MSDRIALPALTTVPERDTDDIGFLDWWLDELAQFVGGSRRQTLRDPIIALWQRDTIHVAGTKKNKIDRFGSLQVDPNDPSALHDARGERLIERLRRTGRPIVLRLDHLYGLIAQDVLPSAAGAELRAVIANRLDLLTPWSAPQAYFDYRLINRIDHAGERQIEIEVGVAPAAVLDPLLDAFAEEDIDIAAVDIVRADPWAPPEIDLLQDNRVARFPRWFQATAAAASIAVAVGGAFLGYEVYLNHQSLDEQRRFATAIETRVAEIDSIKADIEAYRAETTLIDKARNELPSALNLIEVLSQTLPDEVWLEGLELDGRDLAINGYAASASELVPLLETTDGLANVQFRAPSTRAVMTTADGASFEAEQFRLGALVAPELEPVP